jgi:hypothetical protein
MGSTKCQLDYGESALRLLFDRVEKAVRQYEVDIVVAGRNMCM